MNFCADLKNVAASAVVQAQLNSWDGVLSHLRSIITNDVSQDFMAPTALALTRLQLAKNTSIGITLTYS